MNHLLKYLFLFLSLSFISIAQENLPRVFHPASPTDPCDVYNKENIGTRRPIPYTYLREGDVMWEKRIWRDVDMREKQNQPFYYPIEITACRSSLFQTLTKHILNGNIIAFADEEFLQPYERSIIRAKLVKSDTIEQFIYKPDGTEETVRVPTIDSSSIYKQVLKFRLKEDWYFDRQKSTLEVRIIGLAAYQYDEDKEAFKELFWVYFPSCRPYFAKNDVYNFKNDAERRSLDDIFWKRQFASVIVKESNVYDRYVNEYEKGIDALVESEKIKMSLFNWEHDLWNY